MHVENDRIDAERDMILSRETRFSANGDNKEKLIFSIKLTTSRLV